MTDNIAPEEQPEETVEAPQEPQQTVEQETDESTTDTGSKTAREAKKYRLKLRETEAERDTLTAGLTAARRQLVQQHLAHSKSELDPAAIDDAGIDIATLFTDGTLDQETLNQQMEKARETKPYLFATNRLYVPGEGGRPKNTTAPNSFANAFKPNKD